MSDLVRKGDGNSGAETGESIGKTVGIDRGDGLRFIKMANSEDQRFQVCMQEKGYMVMGS